MTTKSKEFLLDELTNEYWQLDFDFERDSHLLSNLEEVVLHSEFNGITQHRLLQYPEFLISGPKVFLLNCGIAIAASQIEAAYLHRGEHRDLALILVFSASHTALRFEFDITESQPLDALLGHVRATHKQLPDLSIPQSITCPCCLEKQAEIRKTPQLHPLFSIFESLAESNVRITLKLASKELNMYETYRLQSSAYLHYTEATVSLKHQKQGTLNVHLEKIYSMTMSARSLGEEDCIEFCLFDSLGSKTGEVIVHDFNQFAQWKQRINMNP